MSTTQIFSNGSALYNNGKVAISKDLIFGLAVFTDSGWTPLNYLNKEELDIVRRLIDNDPLFLWKDQFQKAYNFSAPILQVNTDATSPSMNMVEKSLEAENTLADIPASKYLADRDKDYRKLLADKEINPETGDIRFIKDGYVYAQVKCTPEGYKLIYTSSETTDLKNNIEEVYAQILKRYW